MKTDIDDDFDSCGCPGCLDQRFRRIAMSAAQMCKAIDDREADLGAVKALLKSIACEALTAHTEFEGYWDEEGNDDGHTTH